MTSEYVDELEKVGHPESIELIHLHDCGYIYVHRSCAMWSIGVIRDPSGTLDNVASAVSLSLTRKCTYCNKFGASMSCKMSCPKYFHLPCVAASGGFQIIQNFTAFCKEHLGQVPLVCELLSHFKYPIFIYIVIFFSRYRGHKLSYLFRIRRRIEFDDLFTLWRSLSRVLYWRSSAARCSCRMAM